MPTDVDLREIQRKIEDLYRWHDKTDTDGARIWYIRPAMIAALESLAETNQRIALLFNRVVEGQDDMKRRLDELEHHP